MYRYTSYGSSVDGREISEVADLQTDVMRFMAILGLCLMAIFALVQSLPKPPENQPPRMENEARLEQELADLKQQVQQLHLYALELGNLMQQANEGRDAAQEKQKQASEAEINGLEQALAQQQQRLADLQAKADQDQLALHRLRRELEQELSLKQQHRRVLSGLQQRMLKTQAETSEQSPETPGKPTQEPPEQEGFTLQFQSDAALHRLVVKGEVKIYAILGGQAWHLTLMGQVPSWRTTAKPSRYHHMSPATVPSLFSRSFHAQQSARGRSDLVWGVTLPQRIHNRIETLMQGRKGGNLVIEATGVVALANPSGAE